MTLYPTRLLSAALLITTHAAQAGIVADATRVIYPADKNEVTLGMFNNAQQPRLIQTWVDSGDASALPEAAKTPFIASPPLFRINADKGQSVRIVYNGDPIPQDRESVYWLNLLEIPPKVSKKATVSSGHVQFAMRTRMKIFYRPANLPGSQQSAISGIRWQIVNSAEGKAMECDNPSAWNVSFTGLFLGDTLIEQNGMCPAKGKKAFPLSGIIVKNSGKLNFSFITDLGGYEPHEAVYRFNG